MALYRSEVTVFKGRIGTQWQRENGEGLQNLLHKTLYFISIIHSPLPEVLEKYHHECPLADKKWKTME